MKKTLVRWLQDAWYQDMYLSVFLVPFSLVYVDVVRLRRFLYRKGLLKSTRLPVPVIIVGNITVGGTGKTPLVIWMVNYLRQQGYRPGVISRGYGGEAGEAPRMVNEHSRPQEVGDEPLLIWQKTSAPVAVCQNRCEAGRFLLEQAQCDILISDDGLQHYALQRDFEIAVVDGQRRFGNGYCLPAGPLREPIERLREVDWVIVNGQPEENYEYAMQFRGDEAVNLKSFERRPLASFADQTCHALAGIGNPDRFFRFLQDQGLMIKEHAFPDHYAFTADDLLFADDMPVLMTEKDAVKCSSFARENYWAVPIQAEPEVGFIQQFQHRLDLKNGQKTT
jgi:tetraacyldisaccharide 4'-kinase